jgi:excisionase family DNA binding protein
MSDSPGSAKEILPSVMSLVPQDKTERPRQTTRRVGEKRSLRHRPPLDRCFTIREVAEFLAYSEKQIRRLCEQGKIRAIKASKHGHYRIPLRAVRLFLKRSHSYWATRSELEFERAVLDSCHKHQVAKDSGRQT